MSFDADAFVESAGRGWEARFRVDMSVYMSVSGECIYWVLKQGVYFQGLGFMVYGLGFRVYISVLGECIYGSCLTLVSVHIGCHFGDTRNIDPASSEAQGW